MNLNRRGLFAIGLAAVAVPALPRDAAAAVDAGTTYPVGDFLLPRAEKGLSVAHKQSPDRVIWATQSDGNFLAAEEASAQVKGIWLARGNVRDQRLDRCALRFPDNRWHCSQRQSSDCFRKSLQRCRQSRLHARIRSPFVDASAVRHQI